MHHYPPDYFGFSSIDHVHAFIYELGGVIGVSLLTFNYADLENFRLARGQHIHDEASMRRWWNSTGSDPYLILHVLIDVTPERANELCDLEHALRS